MLVSGERDADETSGTDESRGKTVGAASAAPPMIAISAVASVCTGK